MKKKTKAKKQVKKAVKKENQKIAPIKDRVLIKPILDEEVNKTASGIIIPDTVSKEKPEQGKVIAVGNEVKSIKAGDKVVFSRYGYEEIKYEGEEYYVLKEENILAIIR